MTNQDILTKAIEKAIAGGWRGTPGRNVEHPSFIADMAADGIDKCYIYQHDFAKALWPDRTENMLPVQPWKHHLQQMVIADDAIAYLGENL